MEANKIQVIDDQGNEKEFEVLFEQEVGENKYEGLTPNYLKTIVTSNEDICGKIMKVKITEVKDEYVEGILV